jgi:aspartate racemase
MTFPTPLVGILGGMGPQAGLDMAEKLIAMTSTQCDQGHIPFMLFSLPGSVPDRTAFLLGKSPENPAYAIATQFEVMAKMGVTIAVMACNTAHASPIFDVVLDQLRRNKVKLEILHLIEETVFYIRQQYPDIKKVGILGTQGTYQAQLYDKALEKAGLEVVLPDPHVRQNDIHAALYAPGFGIKTSPGTVTKKARKKVLSAIHHLKQGGAGVIVLGCTELPLAVKEGCINDIPILDPAKIMVEKLIRKTYPHKLLK